MLSRWLKRLKNKDNPRLNEANPFDFLPTEVIHYIFSFLNVKDLAIVAQLNKRFLDDTYNYPIQIPESKELPHPTYYQLIKEFHDAPTKIKQIDDKIQKNLDYLFFYKKNKPHGYRVILDIQCALALLISMGAGIYIEHIFRQTFDSYFVSIENGTFGAAIIFFGSAWASGFLDAKFDISGKIGSKIDTLLTEYEKNLLSKISQLEDEKNIISLPRILKLS